MLTDSVQPYSGGFRGVWGGAHLPGSGQQGCLGGGVCAKMTFILILTKLVKIRINVIFAHTPPPSTPVDQSLGGAHPPTPHSEKTFLKIFRFLKHLKIQNI